MTKDIGGGPALSRQLNGECVGGGVTVGGVLPGAPELVRRHGRAVITNPTLQVLLTEKTETRLWRCCHGSESN